MKKTSYELYLTSDTALLEQCKNEIRKTFGRTLRRLVDVKDESELSDCYKIILRIPAEEIWNTARKLILINGVIDVDPDLKTSLDQEYEKIFVEETRELEHLKERPVPVWFHENTRFKEALEYVKSEFENGRGFFNPATTKISIAHFDTGYTDHPELELMDKKAGYNYVAGFVRRILYHGWQRDARDMLRNFRPFMWASHGTATASVIIGTRIKETRFITGPLKDRVDGVMPNNVDLIPFRISETIISFDNKMVHAVDQVIRMGNIRIITMSHASLFRMQSWKQAVDKAYNRGIIWVSAGGSHGYGRLRSILVFPAKFQETIATAASTYKDVPWERTHFGKEIDICAPGFDIYVPSSRRRWYGLLPDQYTYKWSEGTSFSTPITAAAAALWLGHHGEAKLVEKYPEPWQIVEAFRKVLKESARHHKPEIEEFKYGAGLLDVLNLVKMELPDKNVLIKVSELSSRLGSLLGSEKVNHITNKEIIYLMACGKIRDMDKTDDSLYNYVYQNGSIDAKKLLADITLPEKLSGEPKSRSEVIKVYTKEFLNSWS